MVKFSTEKATFVVVGLVLILHFSMEMRPVNMNDTKAVEMAKTMCSSHDGLKSVRWNKYMDGVTVNATCNNGDYITRNIET
jgi:hypothetical protein